MKVIEIKSYEDVENYVEGTINDFEGGVSDKQETINAILELVLYLTHAFTEKQNHDNQRTN